MAAMIHVFKRGLNRYAKARYPGEAKQIIRKAGELFPVLRAKAPDIGGKENLMAFNLDLMILAASWYEASVHRIDGAAITEIAGSQAALSEKAAQRKQPASDAAFSVRHV